MVIGMAYVSRRITENRLPTCFLLHALHCYTHDEQSQTNLEGTQIQLCSDAETVGGRCMSDFRVITPLTGSSVELGLAPFNNRSFTTSVKPLYMAEHSACCP